jgi:hypothetical protein
VADGAAILNADLTRKDVVFRAGGDGGRRQGEIVVAYDPHLFDRGYLGQAWYWVRDADREAVVAAKVWMGVGPEDSRFREVLLHEIGHGVGLNHEPRSNASGDPISIMHPFAITGFQDYAPDDLRGFAKLRYRSNGKRRRGRRRRNGGRN